MDKSFLRENYYKGWRVVRPHSPGGANTNPYIPFLQEFATGHFNNLFQPTRRWDADVFDATNLNRRSNCRFQRLP